MFRRLDAAAVPAAGATVRVTVDGTALECRETDTVAAILFAAGMAACRDTAVSGAARGPFCMMGVCYDCLVSIDGRPNQQACMTRVRDGMRIERQPGAREVAA
ncbi:(2Fe-2S)-binding protein [Cupriavidus agavae]|uniref:2Fe-2S iron-sulfur cluster protein n=1 Tax=Cupriavidus agavae TaxID=1001822 RepID=A0A4Q7S0N6_9BURK|nr:(2Fe-2S)-binding protein [Cupriavidus agavae]RZT39108.1 2Fe-2S iron-sulfur cluster protein [Cupriavidus agavae]